MIKFIFKIFKFIFTVFITFTIFAYIISIKTNKSFDETVAYFKNAGNEVINAFIPQKLATNTNIQITTSKNKHYYYNQLDNNAKIIYSNLEANIDNLKTENYVIDFSTTFNDLLHESLGQYKLNKSFQSALDAFFYDYPELFYLDVTKFSLTTKSVSIGPMKTYTVKITPSDGLNYLSKSFPSEKEVDNAIRQVESVKKSIIQSLTNENIYAKLLKVHNMLVNSIEYDQTYNKPNTHNIYGALVEKQVVCEGYAKAYKYILDSLNIECILVNGSGINSSNETELHMWNYVKLNGSWYGVDVTWDDPIIIGGYVSNNLRHDYFLKGSTKFIHSHYPSGKISDSGMLFDIPKLSANDFNQ